MSSWDPNNITTGSMSGADQDRYRSAGMDAAGAVYNHALGRSIKQMSPTSDVSQGGAYVPDKKKRRNRVGKPPKPWTFGRILLWAFIVLFVAPLGLWILYFVLMLAAVTF